MKQAPLEDVYFEWLAVRVVNVRQKNANQTRWSVLRKLHSTPFIWRIRNDDNRAEDGKELRSMFVDGESGEHGEYGLEVPTAWLQQDCSFLEMLIALSDRLAFQTEGLSLADWFWHLLNNVGLNVSDYDFERQGMNDYTDAVMRQINDRTYDWNGHGGLFPLQQGSEINQAQIELWFQMNYYLLERS